MLPYIKDFYHGKAFSVISFLQLDLLIFSYLSFPFHFLSFYCLPFISFLFLSFPSFSTFLNSYIYEVSRRNPFVFAPTLLMLAARFEAITKTCCEEQDKANCFQTKVSITFISLKDEESPNIVDLYLKLNNSEKVALYL